MKYENKTNEELIEILEERDEEIEQLESRNDDLENEVDTLSSDLSSLEAEMVHSDDEEGIAEKAFNAGFEAKSENQFQAWLNYKVEARL